MEINLKFNPNPQKINESIIQDVHWRYRMFTRYIWKRINYIQQIPGNITKDGSRKDFLPHLTDKS